MQEDFHYYATYCAAYLSGYSHMESLDIAYSAQFVDCCSRTFLKKVKGPMDAATTQLQAELVNCRTDIVGLQDITRIWASFHFLPRDLYAPKAKCTLPYLNKYRLICGPNGPLAAETVRLAKDKPLQAAGIAMHVLADTWAHMYFAGTPSLVINNTNYFFYELCGASAEGKPEESGADAAAEPEQEIEKHIKFRHNASEPDDLEKGLYSASLYQNSERSIMNLGHGRAGHLPDYSFIRYKYMPAWAGYEVLTKDNPSDYFYAFCQMIYALKYLRGSFDAFELNTYDEEAADGHRDKIMEILEKRRLNACDDWKSFGETLSGAEIPDFDINRYNEEYINADREARGDTFLGNFFKAAQAQKSMVTNKIYKSGNMLAGFSLERLFKDNNLIMVRAKKDKGNLRQKQLKG